MTLYVNACVRPQSRTDELARFALLKSGVPKEEIQEVNLQDERIFPLDRQALETRDALIARGRFDDDFFSYARQFAAAEQIFISAPYWDLLFPASLRIYFERVCVVGLTFAYTESGEPKSLCKARRLSYVTTAGGLVGARHLGFEYVKEISSQFFGIRDFRLIQAEGLDLAGADPRAILEKAKRDLG